MNANGESNKSWLAKKYFDEVSLQFRTVWDLYIKFYTIFLTFNIAGIAATVQYISQDGRHVVVAAFVTQNLVALITALQIAYYSKSSALRSVELADVINKGDGE